MPIKATHTLAAKKNSSFIIKSSDSPVSLYMHLKNTHVAASRLNYRYCTMMYNCTHLQAVRADVLLGPLRRDGVDLGC